MTFKNKEEKYLHQFNELVAKHSWELPENTLPPIFIVGAPRSGTTLLTQVLISSFELGYIDNISSKFWTNPLMGVIISNAIEPFQDRILSDYSSNIGFTKGANGPHEFGYFWKRWFSYGKTHELTDAELKRIPSNEIQKEIHQLSSFFNIPFLFKNAVAITLQVAFLARIFPKAIFLYCNRDPLFNAQSLLLSRQKHFNGIDKWFSAKPLAYLQLKDSPIEDQIAGQVYYCNKIILDSVSLIENRMEKINYKQFCINPEETIQRIQSHCLKHGLTPKIKSVKWKPFEHSNKRVLPKNQFQKLESALQEYF